MGTTVTESRVRPRTWATAAALVVGVLVLVFVGSSGHGARDAGGPAAAGPASEECAELRELDFAAPHDTPNLVLSSYGASNDGKGGPLRFHAGLRLGAGDRPLVLGALEATVTVCAPHTHGLLARAEGLTPRVTEEGGGRKAGATGGLHIKSGAWADLRLSLPKSALRPGVSFEDLVLGDPPRSNDAADHPLLIVTLTAPGLPGPLTAGSCAEGCAEILGRPVRQPRPGGGAVRRLPGADYAATLRSAQRASSTAHAATDSRQVRAAPSPASSLTCFTRRTGTPACRATWASA